MQSPEFERHARCPKPRVHNFVPAVRDEKLSRLIGRLAPPERRALAQIAETADLLIIEGRPWLLIQATDRLVDALAAFGAELEDREPTDLDDADVIEGDNDSDALEHADDEASTTLANMVGTPHGATTADIDDADKARLKYRARRGAPQRRFIGPRIMVDEPSDMLR